MYLPKHAVISVKPMVAELQQQLLRSQLKAAGVAVGQRQQMEMMDALREVPTPLNSHLITRYSAFRGSTAPVVRFPRSFTSVVDALFERLPFMGLNDRCMHATNKPCVFLACKM
jgi:hypothetical protein